MDDKKLIIKNALKSVKEYDLDIPKEKLINLFSNQIIEAKLNDGTVEKVDRMLEFALCKISVVYFIDRYCRTFDPVEGPIPFKIYDFQKKSLVNFQIHDRCIFRKSRQVGASVISGCFALWMANFKKAQMVSIISLNYSDALDFKQKTVDLNYDSMPPFLKCAPTRDGYSKTKLKLKNLSQITVKSKSKNAGRGGSPSVVIIDECAFNEFIDDIWKSIEPSLKDGTKCILISTTNGLGNFYEKTWTKAVNGQNEFFPIFIPWWRFPGRSNPWLDDIIKKERNGTIDKLWLNNFIKEKESEALSYLGEPKDAPWLWKKRNNAKDERSFRQEILADFLGSGDTFFSMKTIKEIGEKVRPPECENMLYNGNSIHGLNCFKDVDDNSEYSICCDVSSGHGNDFSSFHVIDYIKKEQVAEFNDKLPTNEYGKIIKKVARYYKNAYVIIETNSLGISVFNEVYYNKEDRYYNVYTQKKGKVITGWTTTPKNRKLLMDELLKVLENNQITMYSERFYEQLKVFTWKNERPEAIAGKNDDLILAIAFHCFLIDKIESSKPLNLSASSFGVIDYKKELITDNTDNNQNRLDVEELYGVSLEDYYWLQGKVMPEHYREKE